MAASSTGIQNVPCPYYRGDHAPRCSAVAGCLPAREVDRKRLCLTDRFERCDFYDLRMIVASPVDPALAAALRDKDLDRRRGRLVSATATWLKASSTPLVEVASPAERLPAQALLSAALEALEGKQPPAATRVVRAPELCSVFDRLARVLRVVARRAPDGSVETAARVLEIGAGLLPANRDGLSW